jgi:hypothetical protein
MNDAVSLWIETIESVVPNAIASSYKSKKRSTAGAQTFCAPTNRLEIIYLNKRIIQIVSRHVQRREKFPLGQFCPVFLEIL